MRDAPERSFIYLQSKAKVDTIYVSNITRRCDRTLPHTHKTENFLFNFLSHRSFLFPQRKVNIQFSFNRLCSQLALDQCASIFTQYTTKFKNSHKKEEKKNYYI